jgi:hypothetical protein
VRIGIASQRKCRSPHMLSRYVGEFGNVLRQLYRNLHGCPSLLSIVYSLLGDSGQRIQHWLMATARYAQVPGFSAQAGTGPSARACDRPPFRRELVSRVADLRGAGAAFPTEGIVTRSNSA